MNQTGGARTDTLVKLVLIFFISLLSFSVGTFVGKEFSDKKHRLASVESEYSDGHDGKNITKNFDGQPEEALTDEDIEKLSQEFVNAESDDLDKPHAVEEASKKDPKAVATSEKEGHREVATVEKKSTDLSMAAKRVAEGKDPSPPAKEGVRMPTSLPPSVVGQYTVQVASYSTEIEAEEHAQKLKNQGFSAFVVTAKVRGSVWYRVSVGAYSTRSEAKKSQERLMKQAKLTSAIVQKIGDF